MDRNKPHLSDLIPGLTAGNGAAGNGHDAPGPAGIPLRPGQTVCGDVDLRIDAAGTWHYHGSPIGRKELVKLFASVLQRDKAGAHWLITPAEVCRIAVEDAPFLAVDAEIDGTGEDQIVTVTTNLDQKVAVDAKHPLTMRARPDPARAQNLADAPGTRAGDAREADTCPYVRADGDARGGLDARIARSVYYVLAENAVAHPEGTPHIYGIWSSGRFFPLTVPDRRTGGTEHAHDEDSGGT